DGGLMDQFVQATGNGSGSSPFGAPCNADTVMDYFDGNTATAMWNYAQRFAMNDNSYGTTFGPSSPGAINLASGDTGNVDTSHMVNSPSVSTPSSPDGDLTPDGLGGYSLTSDAQPYWDDCSTRDAAAMSGTNIGDELNRAGLSWGWFQGGFRPTESFSAALAATGHSGQPTGQFIPDEFASAGFQNQVPHSSNEGLCDAVHPVGVALGGSGQWGYKNDYIPHHEPFQYYASTANPHHLTIATTASGADRVTGADSLATVGTDTQSFSGGYGVGPQFNTPNHQYDTSDFNQLVAAITAGKLPPSALPAVTFLKAPGYEDGHAAYSDPADEQAFVVREVDALMRSPDWSSTAVIVNWDDSDGWYDHSYSGVTNPSLSVADNLTNTTLGTISAGNPVSQQCGPSPQTAAPLGGEQGRCGFGPRLPMLVISPWARTNYVDHNLTDQASIINFIEYNWSLPHIPGSYDNALRMVDQAEHVPFDLAGMFDFRRPQNTAADLLDPTTGQVDVAGMNLSGQLLTGLDLAHAAAAGVNLSGATLSHGFLVDANLNGADLEGANLAAADLNGADLHFASLQSATLTGADLTGADLYGANLTRTRLSGVIWSNTTCPDGSNSNQDGNTCKGHL
ncbi:MAG TPA: alkaline phosphatase family protein, partial [Thermoleophilia bacterium]|nr:alkaline phosphatase family protein [Thermoleophilia bacterium]